MSSLSKFYDKDHKCIALPYSLKNDCFGCTNWSRPDEYIRDYNMEKDIKMKYPNKNHAKIKKNVKSNYYSDVCVFRPKHIVPNSTKKINLDVLGKLDKKSTSLRRSQNSLISKNVSVTDMVDKDESDKVLHFEYFIYLEMKLHIYVIKTDSMAKPKYKNLDMTDKYCKFSKWVCSVFQNIIDMNLTDVNSGETLYDKIYPKENGVPIYNPYGKYWVKLFFMGKYRKIEIDDRMPCDKFERFMLPHTSHIEELWPALLTKALIKLYSFKYKFHPLNIMEEIGDGSIFYSLTGYLPEKIRVINYIDPKEMSLTNSSFNYEENKPQYQNFVASCNYTPIYNTTFLKILQNILNDTNFIKKQKLAFGFHSDIADSVIKLNSHLNLENIDDSEKFLHGVALQRDFKKKATIGQNFFKQSQKQHQNTKNIRSNIRRNSRIN